MKSEEIISLFCLCSDLCNQLKMKDHHLAKMAHCEVITVGIIAAQYFGGNIQNARNYSIDAKLFSHMISREELTRRLLRIPEPVWAMIITLLAKTSKSQNTKEYIIDSFPLPFCHPCRSKLCKLAEGKEFIGYCASKKMYYYGMKAHVLVNSLGELVELKLTPACISDTLALDFMDMNLPKESLLYGDKAYNSSKREERLFSRRGVRVFAQKKKNSKTQHNSEVSAYIKKQRKRVEVAISAFTRRFPRAFYVRSFDGFKTRVILGIIATVISHYSAL